MTYDADRERRRARWVRDIMCLVAVTALLAIYGWMLMRIADEHARADAAERSHLDPAREMVEYRTVVHALDRCYQRLDEEQQNVLGMWSELSHWNYVERITHMEHPDAEINCQGLLHRALQDVWFDAESALYDCQQIQRDECWCLFEEEAP